MVVQVASWCLRCGRRRLLGALLAKGWLLSPSPAWPRPGFPKRVGGQWLHLGILSQLLDLSELVVCSVHGVLVLACALFNSLQHSIADFLGPCGEVLSFVNLCPLSGPLHAEENSGTLSQKVAEFT